MAGKADIEAGKAFVRLYINDGALVKGLQSASKQLKSWGESVAKIGGSLMAAGGAVLAPLGAMVASFSEAGSQLADMSARTGASAETLSALGYAAGMTGASMEDVEKAMRKMQQNGMSADQIGAIADQMAAITDPAERTRLAMDTFGKSGAALIPMLSGGSAGLAEFRAEAERLGLVMSTEDANAADALGDAMDKVTGSMKGAVMQIGAALAPTVTKLANIITDLVAVAVDWLKNNRQLVVTVAAVAAGVAAVGAVLVGLGGAISVVGFALSGLATAIGAVGAALAFLVSPIGLVIVAVGGAIYAFLRFTTIGQQTVGFLRERFGSLIAFVKDVIGGISDAFAAGDMTLAANIAWAGVQLAFYTAKDSLLAGFDTIKAAGALAWSYLKLMFVKTMNPISTVWDQIWTGMMSIFDGVVTSLRETWNSVIGWIAQQMLKLWGVIEKVLNALGLISEKTDIKGAMDVVDQENKRSAKQLEDDKARRDQERGAKLAKNEKERADSLAAAEKERQDAMSAWASAGAGGESPETKAAREELDRLRKQAAEAAAAAAAGEGTGLAGPGEPVIGKSSVASTFSSAALMALGAGGGPMDKLLKTNEDQKKIQQKQLETAQAMASSVISLNTLLALTP